MVNIIESIDKEQGYIYVIKVLGYYKIGKTQNPNNRFGEYTKLMQEPEIIILKKVCDYHNVEIELHNMYSHKHTRGEWYSLEDNDIYDIKWYLEYFDVSTMKLLISTMLKDFIISQIENHFGNLVEVNMNDDDGFYLTLKIGEKLKTKIPIYHGTDIIKNLSDIIKVFSEKRELINQSIQYRNALKQEEQAS